MPNDHQIHMKKLNKTDYNSTLHSNWPIFKIKPNLREIYYRPVK
jgi:hypothetical protein